MTPPIKGYNLSTDYALLYNLICSDGYRIPAWVLYERNVENPIWDIVEVKAGKWGLKIGYRGMGYEPIEIDFESFAHTCRINHLHFIPPPTQP